MKLKREPRAILWWIVTNDFNDSLTHAHFPPLQKAVQEAFPTTEQITYTCARDGEFANQITVVTKTSYTYTARSQIMFKRFVMDHYEQLSMAAKRTAEFLPYEIIISSDLWALGAFAYTLYPYYQACLFVYVPPLAPNPRYDWGCNYKIAQRALRVLKDYALAVFVLDNEQEERNMLNELTYAGAGVYWLRRIKQYVWSPKRPKKQDVVIWGGRSTAQKNLPLLWKVMSLINYPKIISFSMKVNNVWIQRFKDAGAEVYVKMPSEGYRKLLEKAKVGIITSHTEGFPVGWVEMVEYGVLPIVWKKEWAFDLFGEDYELYFEKPEEVPGLVEHAMKHYDELITKLQKRFGERLKEVRHFGKDLKEIWNEFVTVWIDQVNLHTIKVAGWNDEIETDEN